MKPLSLAVWLLCAVTAHAQLAVSTSPPKLTGTKAVVKLEMKSGFTEKIESARAVCFLHDEKGKVIGQSSQWVIGGTRNRASLGPGATNTFNFVISAQMPPTATNLTADVRFSRVILEGGRAADVVKEVRVTQAAK